MRCYRYLFYDEEINVAKFCQCIGEFHCDVLCPIIKYDENETYFYGEEAISTLVGYFLLNKGMNI